MSGPGFYLAVLLYTLPGLIIGLVVHELTHSAVALRFGDPSPRRDRLMTLDPRKHVDPLGLAMLVLSGFGWSKPVRLDPVFLRDARHRAAVAASGPLAHLVIAAFFAVALRVEVAASGLDVNSLEILAGFTAPRILFGILLQGFFINVALFVFNALPLPGLDGYAVLRSLLFSRVPQLFQWLEHQRLVAYAAVAVVVVSLPELTHGAVNPFAAATTGSATALYTHLVEPGVMPLLLGLPNIFSLFTA
jgi:Zn-dependent protease